MFPTQRLAGRVPYAGPLPQEADQVPLGQTRNEMTSVSAGVELQKEMPSGLQTERPPAEAPQPPSKEAPEGPTDSPTSQGKPDPQGQEAPDPRGTPSGRAQHLPCPEEDLFSVGTTNHQPNEVQDLPLGDPLVPAGFIPVPPDLSLHHIVQAEAPRKGFRGVLVVQHLTRGVLKSDGLQKGQGHRCGHLSLPLS